MTIKLVKSLIGSKKDQIATAHALGLKKIGDVTTQPDNAPANAEPIIQLGITRNGSFAA